MPEGVRVYFDTMLYLNKFEDPMTARPETINVFNKVKSGEFHLVISQLNFIEMYHVMCLPLVDIKKFEQASDAIQEINSAYMEIKKTLLQFPHTEIVENEFNGIDTKLMTAFVENVPGSNLIDFLDMRKYPGSMDFIHLMTASNLKCEKFFTNDNGILLLNPYNHKGNMKIIKPQR